MAQRGITFPPAFPAYPQIRIGPTLCGGKGNYRARSDHRQNRCLLGSSLAPSLRVASSPASQPKRQAFAQLRTRSVEPSFYRESVRGTKRKCAIAHLMLICFCRHYYPANYAIAQLKRMGSMMERKKWTQEENEQLKTMYLDYVSMDDLIAKFGVKESVIYSQCKKLGIRRKFKFDPAKRPDSKQRCERSPADWPADWPKIDPVITASIFAMIRIAVVN
jgi:transposase